MVQNIVHTIAINYLLLYSPYVMHKITLEKEHIMFIDNYCDKVKKEKMKATKRSRHVKYSALKKQ